MWNLSYPLGRFEVAAKSALSVRCERADHGEQHILPHRSGQRILGLAPISGRDWKHQAPCRIMDEILAGQNNQKGKKNEDLLLTWIRQPEFKNALLLDEQVDPELVAAVIERGYAVDLTDTELEEIGRDPFLIAYGTVSTDRCVDRGVEPEQETPEPKNPRRLWDTRRRVLYAVQSESRFKFQDGLEAVMAARL